MVSCLQTWRKARGILRGPVALLALLTTLAFSAAGCSGRPATAGSSCQENLDCPGGSVCVEGICTASGDASAGGAGGGDGGGNGNGNGGNNGNGNGQDNDKPCTDGDQNGVCDPHATCADAKVPDADNDGICDPLDLCFGKTNVDDDGDGLCNGDDPCFGDDNSTDEDRDGLCLSHDSCPTGPNVDLDQDGLCDSNPKDTCLGVVGDPSDNVDSDGDGFCDGDDRCDGTGTFRDDADGDGLCGEKDPCFGMANSSDVDGDGVCDDQDPCYGFQNTADADKDGDGICDSDPTDLCIGLVGVASENKDDDGDGWCNENDGCQGPGRAAFDDYDNDGLCGNLDPCLGASNIDTQDNDGWCDADGDPCVGTSNIDDDNDGICNEQDVCPQPNGALPGEDSDGDGICDVNDVCPNDDNGQPGTDTQDYDGDGVASCEDICPGLDDGQVVMGGPDVEDVPTTTAPTSVVVDTNCDGVDGVASMALFVAPAPQGSDNESTNDGSVDKPYATIAFALTKLGSGKDRIYAAKGTYPGSLVLPPGAKVFGGYQADFSARVVSQTDPLDPAGASIIDATAPEGSPAVVPTTAVLVKDHTVGGGSTGALDGFTITVGDASVATDPSSRAVVLVNVTDAFQVANNHLYAGNGLPGVAGTAGVAGVAGSAGVSGIDGVVAGVCVETQYTSGGVAGQNTSCPGANGGDGGASRCGSFTEDNSGIDGADSAAGVAGGAGGSTAAPNNQCNAQNGYDGQHGSDGTPGNHAADSGAAQADGSVLVGTDAQWQAFPGADGTDGAVGQGGGGGGANSGFYCAADPSTRRMDGSGGGGGAGGCGGTGATGGQGGGGSFGIVLQNAPAATVQNNQMTVKAGGKGGDGATGGVGGTGASGGVGGVRAVPVTSRAGQGGSGGDGGAGGCSEGGAGGSSVAILVNASAGYARSNNTVTFAQPAAEGGSSGAGCPAHTKGEDGRQALVWD